MAKKRKKLEAHHAIFSGTLEILDLELPCYVLENGQRVFSMGGILKTLNYGEKSNARKILANKAIQPYLDEAKFISGNTELIPFDTGGYGRAYGYDVEQFMDICHAYSKALEENVFKTPKQRLAAARANAVIRACSKVGIIALVDEATGYQYARKENELQFKLKLYLAEEMRGWEKTFPDDLWIQFARLTNWDGEPTKNRPRYWGYLVMEFIYRYLDPDVAKYLKENKPPAKKGQNYHQWFNSDYGVIKLREHINRIIGLAQGCDSMDELKRKTAHIYGKKPLQLEMFLEKDLNPHDNRLRIINPNGFEDTLGKILNSGS